MISFNFTISNPWHTGHYRRFLNVHKLLTKFKVFEVEVTFSPALLFSILVDIAPVKRSHAGISFSFALLGLTTDLNFYDTRHWDHRKNCWETVD